jgi:hypothetical protein
LGRYDWTIDLYLRDFRVGKEEGDVEVSNVSIVISCYTAIIWE